jgi:hypothetical protein
VGAGWSVSSSYYRVAIKKILTNTCSNMLLGYIAKKKKETGFCISFYKMAQYNFVFNSLIHVLTYNLEDISVNTPFQAF